jgi:twitching motility two-component system response regulator PilG
MQSMMSNGKAKLAGLKVLVIDDSKTIRRTAETLLTKEGCEVFTAVDGFDALSKIADHQPDIVFVDIMMPRLDGYQTCSLIKHNKVFRQIPVIMLSSKDGLFDRARGRIVGSEHYLTKPFTKDELLGAIEAHVGMALILIIDDSPTEVFVMQKALEKHGFKTASAENGEEGIRKAKAMKPDLIFMDIVMPGVNGFQATRMLNNDPETSLIPIIMVTTKGQETDRVWGLRQGAVDYLVKPVSAQALVEKAQAALAV